MFEQKLYLEIDNLARDDDGNPCPAGMTIELGSSETPTPYEVLVNRFKDKVDTIAKLFSGTNITAKDIHIITPEEYQEQYGDDDDE